MSLGMNPHLDPHSIIIEEISQHNELQSVDLSTQNSVQIDPTIMITERDAKVRHVSIEVFQESPLTNSLVDLTDRSLIHLADTTDQSTIEGRSLSNLKKVGSETLLHETHKPQNPKSIDDLELNSDDELEVDDDDFESLAGDDDDRNVDLPNNVDLHGTDEAIGEQLEGGERIQERNLDEVNPGQVELGLRQANAVPLKVGEGEVNDIGQRNDINTDVKTPPQRILRDAIALAKQTPGFENAAVKVKSSLDQELRSDDATFKVETAFNDNGVLLYKVSVDYTIELKGDNDEVMTMTLNRVFYSNAANEKEALLAIYNVAKSVKQQATAENLPNGSLDQGVFNISLARDPKTKAITGIRSIKSENGIDFTPRTSGRTTFGRDIDERGQVKLRSARQGEVEEGDALSKQGRILRANIQFTDVPILDRLKKQKIDTKRYIDDQADRTRHLNDQFSTLKEQLVKDDLLKWIVKNKKNFNTQVDNILAGKVDPKGLPLSEKMQEYLSLRQQHVKIKPLVEEFTVNREAQESLKQMRGNLRAGRELKPEDRDLINSVKSKMGVSLETPSDDAGISALIDGLEIKQNALRREIGSRDPAGKLVELEAAYAEARVGALKEHQGLFANLGQMQDIQRELKDKKSKLEEMRTAIKADGNMPTDVAQWRLAMIEETVGKIDEQLEANAKVLNVEGHLGKLFEQEIVSTPVRQTVVSSAPDQIE